MHNKRFQDLQKRTESIEVKLFDLESKNRTEGEKDFFIIHGYWPEAVQLSQRTERSFTTHGLKTTVILERTISTDETI